MKMDRATHLLWVACTLERVIFTVTGETSEMDMEKEIDGTEV